MGTHVLYFVVLQKADDKIKLGPITNRGIPAATIWRGVKETGINLYANPTVRLKHCKPANYRLLCTIYCTTQLVCAVTCKVQGDEVRLNRYLALT